MDSEETKRPIGIFDSGMGGLTVLRECVKIMGNEDYIFYGDSIQCSVRCQKHGAGVSAEQKNSSAFLETKRQSNRNCLQYGNERFSLKTQKRVS